MDLALSCFLISLSLYFFASGFLQRIRAAASEKAHLRWTFPIFFPEEPRRFPADSLADLTKRR